MGSLSTSFEVTQIGVIGTGVMGSMLALLLAEHANVDVFIHDRSAESMQQTILKANEAGLTHRVHACPDYKSLVASFTSRKVFLFSLPHGAPGDAVVDMLSPYLCPGDIVIDGSNEDFLVTERRQSLLQPLGVAYVGMGVSGGFSGARNGPSLMPSGDEWALDALMPLLERIAAKDEHGDPCVTKVGPGGAGHYVKMVHNGIEHGVMSALCEAWGIMHTCLGMSGDEIAEVFDSWNESGPLRNNFLVSISGPICRTRNNGPDQAYLLPLITDAVVQDANNSEGTGVWANVNAVLEHVPAPTLTAAHYLRNASANTLQRRGINTLFSQPSPTTLSLNSSARQSLLTDLHSAVYAATLSSFIQGLDLLATASLSRHWNVSLPSILRIWRQGCIIKSDAITDLLTQHYASPPSPPSNTKTMSSYPTATSSHPLLNAPIATSLSATTPGLKRTVLAAITADAPVPALSATLEYVKYVGSTKLPTQFMQAQLDAFGKHGFELLGEEDGVRKGRRSCAWGGR